MKPPYQITSRILSLLASVSEKIGEVNALYLDKPSPELRKRNRVKTIQASLEIEGNTMTVEQISAVIDNKRVIGPQKDILEVMNAIKVYDLLPDLEPQKLRSFLYAHRVLMEGLVESPGKLRQKAVGIVKGSELMHLAPPHENLNFLLKDLFSYLSDDEDPILIKSCVIHYEIEFIHPFTDGNGRMGRLWQTLILMNEYPVFEYLPFETIIKERQTEYYEVLSVCDNTGTSTPFIEFMLAALDAALLNLLHFQNRTLSYSDRLQYFISVVSYIEFTRKDYMQIFKDISTATASRDLRRATEEGKLEKIGTKRLAKYKVVKMN